MNDFSFKFIKHIYKLFKDQIEKGQNSSQEKLDILNKKIFFLFENDKDKKNIKGY